LRWHLRDVEAEEVADLVRRDDHRYPGRKSRDQRMRDELDQRSELEDPEQNENDAGHERCHGETRFAVLLHDCIDDNDKRASWTTDLHPRTTERGDQKAGD